MKKTTAKLNKWIVGYQCGGYADTELVFCGIVSFAEDWSGYVIDSIWDNKQDARMRTAFIRNNGVRGEKVDRVWLQPLISRGCDLYVEEVK